MKSRGRLHAALPLLSAVSATVLLSLLGWAYSLGGGGVGGGGVGAAAEASAASLLGVVMPLSSIEARAGFAEDAIREAARVSGAVVVAYASHLADGTAEDLSYVDALRARLEASDDAKARIIWVPVRWDVGASSRFWVRYLRWAALPRLPDAVRAVLWLDGDEVVDAPRFRAWWAARGAAAVLGRGGAPLKLANFVYFREARFQAVQLEDSAVICARAGLTVAQFFDNPDAEREMFAAGARRLVPGLDGAPLVHHYSWVRSKPLMLQKVRAWTHNADAGRDWVAAVEAEFAHPFSGRDIVHGEAYVYRTLKEPTWIDTLRSKRSSEHASEHALEGTLL